jgi:uncharacterized protein (TIGR02611 family)
MEGSDSDERLPPRTPHTKHSLTAKIDPIRAWFHSRPGGPALFRTLVALLGLLLVGLGLVLVPLPGPGWLIVLAGIAIWGIEFVWARHLLLFTRERLHQWNAWQRGAHWAVRALLLLGLLAIGAASAWLWIRHGLGLDPIKAMLGGSFEAGRASGPGL